MADQNQSGVGVSGNQFQGGTGVGALDVWELLEQLQNQGLKYATSPTGSTPKGSKSGGEEQEPWWRSMLGMPARAQARQLGLPYLSGWTTKPAETARLEAERYRSRIYGRGTGTYNEARKDSPFYVGPEERAASRRAAQKQKGQRLGPIPEEVDQAIGEVAKVRDAQMAYEDLGVDHFLGNLGKVRQAMEDWVPRHDPRSQPPGMASGQTPDVPVRQEGGGVFDPQAAESMRDPGPGRRPMDEAVEKFKARRSQRAAALSRAQMEKAPNERGATILNFPGAVADSTRGRVNALAAILGQTGPGRMMRGAAAAGQAVGKETARVARDVAEEKKRKKKKGKG